MYGLSPLLAKAIEQELLDPRAVIRLARRVARRAPDLPTRDLLWADQLVYRRLLTRYQARALLSACGFDSCLPRRAPDPLRIDRFVVLDRVGHSDLGTTYRCRTLDHSEHLAIKWLDPKWCQSSELAGRLESQLAAWRELRDERVLTADRLYVDSGRLGLKRPWATGASLAERLPMGQRYEPRTALEMVHQLLAILASAEARGLVHGDVKPGNVFLDGRGTVQLLDFGVRSSIPGAAVRLESDLPPERYDYVAPERIAGPEPPDAASDIYALGCLLYRMLTGRVPVSGGTADRKWTGHRAGRWPDPSRLGIDVGPDAKLLLSAMLEPDRSRRAANYNELLSRLAPTRLRARRLRLWPRRARAIAKSTGASGPIRAHDSPGALGRCAAVAVTAALALVAAHGSARILPLLRLAPSTARTAAAPIEPAQRGRTPEAPVDMSVASIWGASDELRRAYRDAAPHATITLRSPGPFLISAMELNKPVTIRGAEQVRPIFLGGPADSLHITAADVRMENVHFLRVPEPIDAKSESADRAIVECSSRRVQLIDCSFQDLSDSPPSAIQWRPATASDDAQASLELERVSFRGTSIGVAADAVAAMRLSLAHCLYLGTGSLVQSASRRGQSFESFDVVLSRVTVYGAGVIEHAFDHPLDDMVPLRVVARASVFVPAHRTQPVLGVRYAAQPAMLMPKVSWSGADSICPADATMLEVERGPDAAPWRAIGFAAWKQYWGTHATGLLGIPMQFGSGEVRDLSAVLPARASSTPIGADASRIRTPDVAIEQLPILLERLRLSMQQAE